MGCGGARYLGGHYGTRLETRGHRDLVVTVNRLAEESGSEILHEEFDAARQFHANFYQNFLDNDEITENRSKVHQFVPTVLNFLDMNLND